jgi:hypothetical protein
LKRAKIFFGDPRARGGGVGARTFNGSLQLRAKLRPFPVDEHILQFLDGILLVQELERQRRDLGLLRRELDGLREVVLLLGARIFTRGSDGQRVAGAA